MDWLNELPMAHTGVKMGEKPTQPNAGLFGFWHRRALPLPHWARIFWPLARVDGPASSGAWKGQNEPA